MQSKVMQLIKQKEVAAIREKQLAAANDITFEKLKADIEKLGLKPRKPAPTPNGGDFEKKDKDYINSAKLLLKLIQYLDKNFKRKKLSHQLDYGYSGKINGMSSILYVSSSIEGVYLYYSSL